MLIRVVGTRRRWPSGNSGEDKTSSTTCSPLLSCNIIKTVLNTCSKSPLNKLHSDNKTNMPGQLSQWPNWPEFTFPTAEKGTDLIEYKHAIIAKYGKEALTQSWLKTCKELETLTQEISQAGTSYIPEVEYEQLLTLSPEEKQKLMDIGCFKVKGVVARKQAEGWFKDLKSYVERNRAAIKGMFVCER